MNLVHRKKRTKIGRFSSNFFVYAKFGGRSWTSVFKLYLSQLRYVRMNFSQLQLPKYIQVYMFKAVYSQWKVAMISNIFEWPDSSEQCISEWPDASERSISQWLGRIRSFRNTLLGRVRPLKNIANHCHLPLAVYKFMV